MSSFDTIVNRTGTDCYKWDYPALRKESADVLPMWVADMDFPAPPEILKAIRDRVEHPVFGYTFAGDAYKDAFVHWQSERNRWQIDTSSLVFAAGVMPAVRAAVLEFSEPGDEIIIQTPVYFPFYGAITDNGRTVVENPLRLEAGEYRIDVDQLRSAITERTRMLLLCSPHNPVGRVWTRTELEQLVQIAGDHDLIIVSDEIHADIVRAGNSFVPLLAIPGAEDHAIATHAPSKTFNLAGLASSTVVIENRDLRTRMEQALYRLGMNLPNLLSLEAAHAAYRDCAYWVDELIDYLDQQIDWFASQVANRFGGRIWHPPIEGTYLAWLDFGTVLTGTGVSHEEMQRTLFREAGLFLSEGRMFGSAGDGFFRVNLATPRARVADGLDRMQKAIGIVEGRS